MSNINQKLQDGEEGRPKAQKGRKGQNPAQNFYESLETDFEKEGQKATKGSEREQSECHF